MKDKMSSRETLQFAPRQNVELVEEGLDLAPKFDGDGLIPVVASDASSGEILMHGYMNKEALRLTIETGEAYYYSRSRQKLWHKGATSGLIQSVVEMRIDDDQDSVWIQVNVQGGASCHVGYRSCFYRSIPIGPVKNNKPPTLKLEETHKVFDPKAIYGHEPNPTKL